MVESLQSFMTFITQYLTVAMVGNLVVVGLVCGSLWTSFDIAWDILWRPAGGYSAMTHQTNRLVRDNTSMEANAARDEGLVMALKAQRDRILKQAPSGGGSFGSGGGSLPSGQMSMPGMAAISVGGGLPPPVALPPLPPAGLPPPPPAFG